MAGASTPVSATVRTRRTKSEGRKETISGTEANIRTETVCRQDGQSDVSTCILLNPRLPCYSSEGWSNICQTLLQRLSNPPVRKSQLQSPRSPVSGWILLLYLLLVLGPASLRSEDEFYPEEDRTRPGERYPPELNHPYAGFPRIQRRQGLGARQGVRPETLERGPLTLINGKLRPIPEEVGAAPSLGSAPSLDRTYFKQSSLYPGRPFEPEIHMTKLPASGDFNTNVHEFQELQQQAEFQEFSGSDNHRQETDQEASAASDVTPGRSEAGDWSTRVNAASGTKPEVVLDTKYFSITYPEVNLGTTSDPGPLYVTSRPEVVLRKVKGKMKTTVEPVEPVSSTVKQTGDPCDDQILECSDNRSNLTVSSDEPGSALPSYEDFIAAFKQEVWVIPVLVAAALIVVIILVFEVRLYNEIEKSFC